MVQTTEIPGGQHMIRVFVCEKCHKYRIVSKRLTADCHECGSRMTVCDMPYVEWVELDMQDRENYIETFIKEENKKRQQEVTDL
ncbi:hypothetical protein [Lachnotalea sp. AF33-28]|uniref:hypothetical protein n=1 Tax=Lachnotalea sp. AF33-28 TaxID=2292046 RepID=UPI0011C36A78|nr:hypothetical protein [Lachnotalea sp. AF33-28]